MLVLNTVYFKGLWLSQFNPILTSTGNFFVSKRETKQIPLMSTDGEFAYYQNSQLSLIKLPYIGNDVEMVILLPRARFGLSNILNRLTGMNLLDYIHKARKTSVEVNIRNWKT
ncbi:unnamed protein product [Thelazia callipaeda]|uniref:SERPIN domain-containing protein n=1 Tax=Thelazia callipaeda TaxID=103827 RepID=A0A0N5CTW9_THECL|nr:unnamed protein product [Thelazia callipaeda]